MPHDPTLPEAAEAPRRLEVDAVESVNVVVSGDTCPGDGSKRPSEVPKVSATDITTSHPTGLPRRPTSSNEAYQLLFDGLESVIIGDFLIERKIGQGGMGAVFRAKQMNLDREVALKVLARHLLDDEKFVHRFKREAKVMARLDHANIIRCYDVGEEHGVHYLAMEYVDGGSLQDLIEKHGKFSLGDALFIALQVADALRYAHELDMVHRDIKPDNVLVTKKGAIKLADLGLAKPINDDLSMTASGVGAGTPTFMAPEQMRSAKEVDGRADIYALGAMLYLMLTGRTPFEGDTLVKLLEAKEKGRFTPARKLNRDVPDKLDLMIEKMLAKSLTVRYQSCAEIVSDLQSLNLANDKFGLFYPDARPSSVARGSKATSASKASAPVRKSSPGSKAGPKDPESIPATGAGWWFIDAGITADGKKRVRKLTPDQIKEQIKSGQLDSTAEASRQPGAGYRALATYKEFDLLFRSMVARKKSDRRSERLQDKYEAIAAEIDSYERKKWWSRFFNNMVGRVMFFVILAAMVGFIYLIVLYAPDVIDFIARKLGLK